MQIFEFFRKNVWCEKRKICNRKIFMSKTRNSSNFNGNICKFRRNSKKFRYGFGVLIIFHLLSDILFTASFALAAVEAAAFDHRNDENDANPAKIVDLRQGQRNFVYNEDSDEMRRQNQNVCSIKLTVCRCDFIGRSLKCGGNNDIDFVPPESPFLNVRLVDLSRNVIQKLPDNAFENFTTLEKLNLSRNKIRRLSKNVFSKLDRLRSLNLAFNRLKRINDFTFKGLRNLHALHLERNGISLLPDGVFYDLVNLTDLYLSRNRLTTVEPRWLYGLKNLRRLYLDYNYITNIEKTCWQFCPSLSILDLSYNQVRSIQVDQFRRLTQLTELDLSANFISQIFADSFISLENLKILDLSGNNLTDTFLVDQSIFRHLTVLEILKINANHIITVRRGVMYGLNRLNRLELSNNSLITLPEGFLPENLKYLQIIIHTDSFWCDCRANWLRNFYYSRKRISSADSSTVTAIVNITGRIKCLHPQHLNGKYLKDLNNEKLSCDPRDNAYFSSKLENKTALVGMDVDFLCSIRCFKCQPSFTWRKFEQIIKNDSGNNYTLKYNENEIHDDIRSINTFEYTSTLSLQSVDLEDNGQYACLVVTSSADVISSKAHLLVQIPPTFTKTPVDLSVPVGGTAKLACSAEGRPQPTLSWRKDHGGERSTFPAAAERRIHVMPNDDLFFIVNVQFKDSGTYTCVASSPAGNVTADAKLTVLNSTVILPTTSIPHNDIPLWTVREGETAVFECPLVGGYQSRDFSAEEFDSSKSLSTEVSYSPTKITWSLNGQPIKLNHRRHSASDGRILVVVGVQQSDTGSYVCKLGDDQWQTLHLTVNRLDDVTVYGSNDILKPEPQELAPTNAWSMLYPLGGAGVAFITLCLVVTCLLASACYWIMITWYRERQRQRLVAGSTNGGDEASASRVDMGNDVRTNQQLTLSFKDDVTTSCVETSADASV